MDSRSVFERVVGGLSMPESPQWLDGHLWFSDCYDYQVKVLSADGALRTVAHVPHEPGGIGFAPDGRLLVVSRCDRRLMQDAGGKLEMLADLSAWGSGKSNDMVVDAQGRAYVGFTGFDVTRGETPRASCIVKVDPDGGVELAASKVDFPNGCVITPDGTTLIVAETFKHRLTAFSIDDRGLLVNRRLFADLGKSCPDGICLDTEGAIWFADPELKQVARVAREGLVTQVISTGDYHAAACALGGADRTTLYACLTLNMGPSAIGKANGMIGAIRVDVPGV